MDGEHIIVTGAGGFIGSACVREFLARGRRVTALVRGRAGAREVPGRLRGLAGGGRLTFASASITDSEEFLGVLSARVAAMGGRCAALVHCAGRATDVGRDRLFRAVNLRGVENVSRAVHQLDIGRLVHMSTTDVYGVRDFTRADESTPRENNRRNPYPKYKILAEDAIRAKLPSDRFVLLRPALVWGPGDETVLPRAVAFLRSSPAIVHFGRWRGRNVWPLAYVGNVARVAYAAATDDAARGQAYNVVDPERTTMEDYYRLLLSLCLPERGGMRSVTVPFFAAWPVAALSTALSTLLGCKRPLFDPSLYSLHHVAHSQDFSGEKAGELLARCGLPWIDRAAAVEQLRTWIEGGRVPS